MGTVKLRILRTVYDYGYVVGFMNEDIITMMSKTNYILGKHRAGKRLRENIMRYTIRRG